MEKIKDFAITMLFLCTTFLLIMWVGLIIYLIGNGIILFLDYMLLNSLISIVLACLNIWIIYLIYNSKLFKLYEKFF